MRCLSRTRVQPEVLLFHCDLLASLVRTAVAPEPERRCARCCVLRMLRPSQCFIFILHGPQLASIANECSHAAWTLSWPAWQTGVPQWLSQPLSAPTSTRLAHLGANPCWAQPLPTCLALDAYSRVLLSPGSPVMLCSNATEL